MCLQIESFSVTCRPSGDIGSFFTSRSTGIESDLRCCSMPDSKVTFLSGMSRFTGILEKL